jgi:hypothetical protein
MVRELVTTFPWGVLLVTDSESTEQIPSWESPTHSVAAAETAVVVRVQHADEGEASVRVISDAVDARGQEIFDGFLLLPSGTVRVSDALGQESLEVSSTPGSHRLRLYADDPLEGTAVDLLLD